MVSQPFFKKTLFVSLLGHLTVFSIFSFSFGGIIHKADYAGVSFLGQFLPDYQLGAVSNIKLIRRFFPSRQPAPVAAKGIINDPLLLERYYFKPPLSLAFNTEKEGFVEKPEPIQLSSKAREPAIIFHPLLPYSFTLYFKDRQIAHVELMFRTAQFGLRNSLAIKRRISSGNLEVDLLVKRYISHYLFIQKTSLPQNNWQTVKIDLVAEND